ncbi:kinase-like protein [Microthyrium microscopicum]|uniref:Kinase-like protein n=1 Tax=Microthyrium microscopicum TaxID=703497 RepID=A0A6A6U1T5_9PEZI|nr:kinase-like protein [Microthyrium microscopicum]
MGSTVVQSTFHFSPQLSVSYSSNTSRSSASYNIFGALGSLGLRDRLNSATASPIRIASPSPHRRAPIKEDDGPAKIDIDKVRRRALKKARKRDMREVPSATYTIRGFETPPMLASGAEESDMSGASTPVLGPMRRNLSSVTSSPSIRPATPSSGIGNLKLKLETLSLNHSPSLRSISMQRTSTNGSRTSEGSESTEMDNYEVQLRDDFVNSEVLATTPVPFPGNVPQQSICRKMCADDFETLTCLGKGTYGTVILVRQRESGRLFAQKQLKKASLVVRKKLVEQTKTERTILESVSRHPFVVKLFYAFQDHEKLYLILEYAQGGELFHHLSMERMFPEETAAFYMAEMVLALEHLHHTVGVVYRDLKPENCLLDSEGHLLLTDFGLSKVATDDADRCKSFLGTIEYMAPEIIQGHTYGMAVDWWSLGAMGFDLLTGSPPFSGNNHAKTQEKIVRSKLQLPYFLGPDAKDLLTRLLRKEPKKRLGSNMPKDMKTLKSHRFFKKIDWNKLAKREMDPPIKPLITSPELAENFSSDFTDQPLSPRISRKSIAPFDEDAMDTSTDPFGGFSYVASSSLLDYSEMLYD